MRRRQRSYNHSYSHSHSLRAANTQASALDPVAAVAASQDSLKPRTLDEYKALLDHHAAHPESYSEILRQQQLSNQLSETWQALAQPPLMQPNKFISEQGLQDMLRLPLTYGGPAGERERLDANFLGMLDHAGGISTLHQDLMSHSADLGQTPVSAFLGYGALQNISQNGMIRACVQTVADDITKKWIKVTGGEEEDTERVEKLMGLQVNKYHLQRVFHQAIELVGYYGGAFIFIDTGVDDEDLSLPLAFNDKSAELRQGAPLDFVVIDPVNVTPAEYNADNPLRKDYMVPSAWWVLGRRVHASRLLVLYETLPPLLLRPAYNFLGIPRAQILWDYVLHWNEARIYANNLLKKVSLLVVKTNTDQIFATPDGVRAFDVRIKALQRYRDNDSIYVCDKTEEDVNNVQTTITGSTDVVRQSLEMVSAINRTPAVKLLGISPSGFNATGESDITNYYDHIQSQQELYRDHITKCLKAIQLVHFGDLDSTIDFEFVELASENDSAKAMNANTYMQMLVGAKDAQFISAEEGRQAIKQNPNMALDFLQGGPPDDEPQDFMDGEGDDPFAQLAALAQQQGEQASPDAPKPPLDDASKTASAAGATQPPLDDASKYASNPDEQPSQNDAEVKNA